MPLARPFNDNAFPRVVNDPDFMAAYRTRNRKDKIDLSTGQIQGVTILSSERGLAHSLMGKNCKNFIQPNFGPNAHLMFLSTSLRSGDKALVSLDESVAASRFTSYLVRLQYSKECWSVADRYQLGSTGTGFMPGGLW